MRILVIGSGGREHALVWKLSQSKLVDKILCEPGNGGISQLAECLDITVDNFEELLRFSCKEKIDLTVVGPEAPLAKGMANEFRNYKLNIFGPTKEAAQLEASKIFAKELMKRYGVPTADFKVFDHPQKAKDYVQKRGVPCVIKAEGLALGKGVVVAKTEEEAFTAIEEMMEKRVFGKAGERIIIEDYLEGEEASIIALVDGKTFILLEPSQDHKRIFDQDRGPNTGGMGAYSPTPMIEERTLEEVSKRIISPTLDALAKEGILYQGALYAGIMLTRKGAMVLEFNVRFGDPETQAILPRLQSDLLEVLMCAGTQRLSAFTRLGGLRWTNQACVCVVCAAEGYPGSYEKGKEIFGLEEAEKLEEVVIFHAGTKLVKEGGERRFFTNGGRVLGVSAKDKDIEKARRRVYAAIERIHFAGMHYRRDIGEKALQFLSEKVKYKER